MWEKNPKHAQKCRKRLSTLRNEGLYTPPSVGGSIVYPFTAGGANWSGAGFDPARQWLVVPVNNSVHVVRLSKISDENVERGGATPMKNYLRGLLFILRGRGTGLRYRVNPLFGRSMLQVGGEPCDRPPWGLLVAVDLSAGEIRWRAPTGRRDDGVEGLTNLGPPLVTASGLVLHAGTRELALRVHDLATGAVLTRFELPAGLHAGPISYRVRPGGRQFLVVAPGGHVGLGSKLGDYVIAYALPDRGT